MNQILEIDNEKRKSPKASKAANTNKAPNPFKGGGNGGSSDKVIKVFAIILAIFAVVLIISGAIGFLNNKKEESNQSNVGTKSQSKAKISAIPDEANNQVILTIESDVTINKVVYNWNTNTEKTIDGQKQKKIEKNIELPAGRNSLNVKVIDTEGNETKESFNIESESGDDIINPNIDLSYTGNVLTIKATDETKMAFLTYRWNDDEVTTVNVDDDANTTKDDDTTITVDLEIPTGTNTITVVAVDASSKHNTKTETKALTGILNPEIKFETPKQGDTNVKFHCTHPEGIKKVKVRLNGNEEEKEFNDDEILTDFEITMPCTDGIVNNIYIEATSVDGTTGTFEGQYDLTHEEDNNDSSDENSDESGENSDGNNEENSNTAEASEDEALNDNSASENN